MSFGHLYPIIFLPIIKMTDLSIGRPTIVVGSTATYRWVSPKNLGPVLPFIFVICNIMQCQCQYHTNNVAMLFHFEKDGANIKLISAAKRATLWLAPPYLLAGLSNFEIHVIVHGPFSSLSLSRPPDAPHP